MQTLQFNKYFKNIVSPIATGFLKNVLHIILTEIFTDIWLTVNNFCFGRYKFTRQPRPSCC